MNIKLKNIGVVKDSNIQLDGLTVITGDNSSGKTTVGKVIYSLIDAVSDIKSKFEEDTLNYVTSKLSDVQDALDIFVIKYPSRFMEDPAYNVFENCPAISLLIPKTRISRTSKKMIRDILIIHGIEDYLYQIKNELETTNVHEIAENRDFLVHLKSIFLPRNGLKESLFQDQVNITELLNDQIEYAIKIIDQIISTIQCSTNQIAFVRKNINETLKTEFSQQIQPVKYPNCESVIEVSENESIVFSIKIIENEIVSNNEPVFLDIPTSSYKKAYFIDNPFIIDSKQSRMITSSNHNNEQDFMIFNPDRILSHEIKLRNIIKRNIQDSMIEQLNSERKLKPVKDKINEVLSGDFEFSSDGDVYIVDGTTLNVTNMATGSKMFAILKLLLSKGEIDEKTLIVLDEPEAHLHPSWQNKFAEIIVLLVKEIGANILLTTHSPNFVLAIDAYMRKYEIQDKTNFYQTNSIDGYFVEYKNVNDDIGLIYDDFAKNLAAMKGLRDFYYYKGLGD